MNKFICKESKWLTFEALILFSKIIGLEKSKISIDELNKQTDANLTYQRLYYLLTLIPHKYRLRILRINDYLCITYLGSEIEITFS